MEIFQCTIVTYEYSPFDFFGSRMNGNVERKLLVQEEARILFISSEVA